MRFKTRKEVMKLIQFIIESNTSFPILQSKKQFFRSKDEGAEVKDRIPKNNLAVVASLNRQTTGVETNFINQWNIRLFLLKFCKGGDLEAKEDAYSETFEASNDLETWLIENRSKRLQIILPGDTNPTEFWFDFYPEKTTVKESRYEVVNFHGAEMSFSIEVHKNIKFNPAQWPSP